MKHFDAHKAAAIIDTLFVTFLFFLAGCIFSILTLSKGGFVILPLMIACGMILGVAGGAYNYYFWMRNGRGAFRGIF